MSRSIFRYKVPVDDAVHDIPCGPSPIVHVEAREHEWVEFWCEIDLAESDPSVRQFQVFGTGHLLPPNVRHVGTALAPYGLVWHLYEVTS